MWLHIELHIHGDRGDSAGLCGSCQPTPISCCFTLTWLETVLYFCFSLVKKHKVGLRSTYNWMYRHISADVSLRWHLLSVFWHHKRSHVFIMTQRCRETLKVTEKDQTDTAVILSSLQTSYKFNERSMHYKSHLSDATFGKTERGSERQSFTE